MNQQDISRLVDTYLPRGLFLDTNLTVLFVVGAISDRLVPKHKRTRAYKASDFELLLTFVGQFKRCVTTVNVLTEATRREYSRLGLADAATIQGIAGSYLVLTADAPLVVALQALDKPVLYFEWLRDIAGIRRG